MPYTTRKGTGKDKGKTCVHKKSSKKKVGCTAGPIEKYLTALRMAESSELDWIRDIPSNQKVKPWNGTIGYPTADKTSPKYGRVYLYTDDEGVTREIKVGGLEAKHRSKNYKGEWFGSDGEVTFYDASIMDSEIQSKNYDPEYPDPYENKYQITMSRQEYNDNARKGKLIITPNNNPIIESEEDFDWVSGFTWYKEMLDSMLSDCKPLRVANFNIGKNQPYMSAGGPSIMFLSRCKEWWDYFSTVPSYPSAFGSRGPAEWFTEDNYDVGEYGVIWNPGWSRKKITPQLEDLKHGYTSAITTGWGYGIEKQLNGMHSGEAWFVVDENNRPVYDLIPEPVKGYAKIYEEEFFGDKLNESNDFDWAKEIPGTKEYGEKYRYFEIVACYGIDYESEECDDEYSHYVRIPKDEVDEIWDRPPLSSVEMDYLAGPGDEGLGVIKYSIKNNLISRYEVLEIIMFEGVRELEEHVYEELTGYRESVNESNDFDWAKEIPGTKEYGEKYRYFEVVACYGYDYETEECDDEYSHFVKIPKDEVDEIWDGWVGYFGGPGDEALGVIDYAINNQLISPREVEEIVAFEGVREINEEDIEFFDEGENINESNDFDWVKDIKTNYDIAQDIVDKTDIWMGDNDLRVNLPFMSYYEGYPSKQLFKSSSLLKEMIPTIMFLDYLQKNYGFERNEPYTTRDAIGVWFRYKNLITQKVSNNLKDKSINESNDFDWIKDIKPKGFEKSKSYVVDVSHLKPYTPMSVSPTSEEYTKLTRADVLDKFKELGYNVDEISIDDADYLYIEPIEGKTGYWNDTVWVKQTHWIDYDMKHNTPDPTYGGKYEIMDIDDLMFLLDNNLISESTDFDWVEDIPLTMNTCEAYNILNPGDEIIIDAIDNWGDNPNQWDDNDEIQTFYNVKAKVLALDECNNIHRGNESDARTILVSIEEDGYYGFDDLWADDFVWPLPKQCQKDNCMFLICDKNEEEYVITLSEPHLNKSTDFDWTDEVLSDSNFTTNTLTEAAGISFEARKWGEIIYNEIMNNPDEKKRLIIDGYDHPEAFDGFPIDYVVIDFYDRLTGYGQEHSGYDKDGNYVVLLYIQPKLVQGQGGYDLRSVLNHEMKHAWEDYNRLSKGLPSVEQTKESQELYNRDFILMLSDQNIRGPIKEILKYYYYLSDLEKSAYLENVYDQNKVYERVLRDIAGKDFNEFKDRFDLDINWHLMNTAYDIPFLKKFKSPIDFIDYSAEELRSKALKMIKKVNKMKYIHKK